MLFVEQAKSLGIVRSKLTINRIIPVKLDVRYQDKIVAYRTVFTNFYPFFLSTGGSYHPKCSLIFEALKAKDIDVIKLNFGMLKHRATAYSIIYDGLRQRRSGVDHFFTPSQQTSTRATLAYAHARFSTVPGARPVTSLI